MGNIKKTGSEENLIILTGNMEMLNKIKSFYRVPSGTQKIPIFLALKTFCSVEHSL